MTILVGANSFCTLSILRRFFILDVWAQCLISLNRSGNRLLIFLLPPALDSFFTVLTGFELNSINYSHFNCLWENVLDFKVFQVSLDWIKVYKHSKVFGVNMPYPTNRNSCFNEFFELSCVATSRSWLIYEFTRLCRFWCEFSCWNNKCPWCSQTR